MPEFADRNKRRDACQVCCGKGSQFSISAQERVPKCIIRIHLVESLAPPHNSEIVGPPARRVVIEIEKGDGMLSIAMGIENVIVPMAEAPIQAPYRNVLDLGA